MEGQVNSLAHFQQHSRLHFIGQWKTKAEDYLKELYDRHPEWNHGRLTKQATFVHLDMDAYFCSVALSKPENAKFRDQPVAIAAGKNNSDVSSCNYVARSYGVRAGMWVGEAKKLCPQLVTLGYDLARCEELNKLMYQSILSCTPPGLRMSLEVYSVDEVMIATNCEDVDVVRRYCDTMREDIARVTGGCTASCGVGPNIFLARLATAAAKPDGVHVLLASDIPALLRVTPISELHGIGRVTLEKLIPLIPTTLMGGRPQTISGVQLPQPPPGLIHNVADRSDVTDERLPPPIALLNPGEFAADCETVPSEGQNKVPAPSCEALQHVSKAALQEALGKKLGEQLFALCRGNDPRVVKRTGDADDQVQLGKQMPNAVGCSMNYAVRPLSFGDVSHVVRQVLGDVSAKLRRRHACATHARLSILERHPDYPKETTKFMGTGRCVEHHISVALDLQAVTGEQEAYVLERCEASLFPRLTTSTAEKAANPHHLMLVEDIRGVTMQFSGLRPIMRRTDGGTEMGPQFRRKIGPGALEGQMSLTAAFHAVRQRSIKRSRDSDEQVQIVSDDDGDEQSDEGRGDGDDDVYVVDASLHNSPHVHIDRDNSVEVVPSRSDALDTLFALRDVVQRMAANVTDESLFLSIGETAVAHFVTRSDLAACRGLLRQAVLWTMPQPSAGFLTLDGYRKLHAIVMQHISHWAQQRGMPSPVLLSL